MTFGLVPDFEAAFNAVRRVERLFLKSTEALNAADAPYMVVGANAVAAWISTVDEDATRTTPDVDVMTSRDCLPVISSVLERIGLVNEGLSNVVTFGDPDRVGRRRCVRALFANEFFKPDDRYPNPGLDRAVQTIASYPVIDLAALIVMKLQSNRDIDRAHLTDLKGVGLITPAVVAKLPPDLRQRLKQIPEPDTH